MDSAALPRGLNPELIARYAVPGPRYTSYPTAVEFTPAFTADSWIDALQREFSGEFPRPLAVYVHIPFCHSLCYFCACHKIILPERGKKVEAYLAAIEREIQLYAELLGRSHPVQQLHWGGGSPNYLYDEETERLYLAFASAFPALAPGADVSIEIDPRTTSAEKLALLRRLGFNRVSLGVQDFDPEVQRLINRIQPYEVTRDTIAEARALGFGSVNVDLIYGLPAQKRERFAATIDRVLELRPDRIALYGYAHVTWLKKVQKVLERAHLPLPAERIELFLTAVERLLGAGYEAVGMDHFALPSDDLVQARNEGRLNRNFMGYSTHRGARLVGFGPSAISSLPAAFAQNEKDLQRYGARLARAEFPIERGLGLTANDRRRADAIERILCSGAIELDGDLGVARDALEQLAGDGLISLRTDRLEVTPLGRYFMRNIAMPFDAYLSKHAAKKVFSQAV